ncbi:hypothetical protein GPECTOR_153g66 [Gonium pectorale]|uniref:Tyr recombinase domain-containing protein n=1 Tax=Gonium pectorale TaxID=33097 RepID=A0A150FXQ1_GONPE|nr:hypothetical protein GPECTOR_153g66 [Gonium pectorale]|eukprot:KXZ42393.1 hypothetical protein GPECTOR_153g66 [Gonium pectorale]
MEGGYVETPAVPLPEAKYRRLVTHLWRGVGAASDRVGRLLLLRDLLGCIYMWESSLRANDCGRLQLLDLVDPACHDQPYAGWPLPSAGSWSEEDSRLVLYIRPHGTKSRRTRRADVFTIASHAEAPYCFVRALSLYLALCAAGGDGFAVANSNALGNRLHGHLVAAGLYEGEACHSFRRGSLQDAEDKGATREQLKAKGQIASESVIDRYLDRTGHQTGRNTRRRT